MCKPTNKTGLLYWIKGSHT